MYKQLGNISQDYINIYNTETDGKIIRLMNTFYLIYLLNFSTHYLKDILSKILDKSFNINENLS